MDEIAFVYDESKGPIAGTVMEYDKTGKPIPGSARPVYGKLDGAPNRDLTIAEFEALKPKFKDAVRQSPCFAPVKKKTTKKDGES